MHLKITAKHDKAEVTRLVKYCAKSVGLDHTHWSVWIKNSASAGRGCCYWDRQHITVGISPSDKFPINGWHGRLAQSTVFETWQECFVWIMAHEFAHAHMWQTGRQRTSESEADWYGWKALQEYRQEA